MRRKKEVHVELRYYEVPQNEYALGLLGDSWKRIYHNPVDDLHFHNLLEIGYCFYGDGKLIFDGGSVMSYTNGSFTVIPQNLPHTTWSNGDEANYWEFLFIDVDALLGSVYSEDQIFAHELIARVKKKAHVFQENETPVLSDSIRAILNEKRELREFGAEIEKYLVLKLLLEIARINPFETEKGDHPQKRRKVILDSLEYVNENFTENIKIKKLAGICHLSETHFRRLFEDTIHMTPVDYINFVRIQKACEYLNSSNDTMENVALKVGYISQSTFNRNFSRFVGVSPHKWKMAADNYKLKLLNYRITALKGW
ncbi:MAG: helix-turn-helix domain-containing protein [Eubacteriales bacterium]